MAQHLVMCMFTYYHIIRFMNWNILVYLYLEDAICSDVTDADLEVELISVARVTLVDVDEVAALEVSLRELLHSIRSPEHHGQAAEARRNTDHKESGHISSVHIGVHTQVVVGNDGFMAP